MAVPGVGVVSARPGALCRGACRGSCRLRPPRADSARARDLGDTSTFETPTPITDSRRLPKRRHAPRSPASEREEAPRKTWDCPSERRFARPSTPGGNVARKGWRTRVHLHPPTVGKCSSVGIGSTLCRRVCRCRTQFSPSQEDRSVGSARHRTSTGEGHRLRDDDRRARSTTRWDTPLGRDGSDVLADVSDMARFAESMGACRILNAAASPKGHRILTQCRNRSAGEPSMS
jgi:hypothetical protein